MLSAWAAEKANALLCPAKYAMVWAPAAEGSSSLAGLKLTDSERKFQVFSSCAYLKLGSDVQEHGSYVWDAAAA